MPHTPPKVICKKSKSMLHKKIRIKCYVRNIQSGFPVSPLHTGVDQSVINLFADL